MCAPLVTRHTSIWYSSSCHTHARQYGCIDLLAQTPSFSKLFIPRTSDVFCRRVLCILCKKCTLHSDHRLTVWYSNTQNDFSPGAAIFSQHTLASPSGRNVNCDEKRLTGGTNYESFLLSVQFRKYVSYGFPIINFYNPRVHYETPL